MLWPLVRKTLRDHWKLTTWWAAGLLAMGAAELWAYTFMAQAGPSAQAFVDSFPESMRKMFRMEDYFSGPGFLGTELYSFMVELVFIAIGASFGAAATAGEEDRGTADVLLGLPVTRTQVLVSKLVALITAEFAVGTLFVGFLWLAMPLADMDASLANIAVTTLACVLLGLFCGGCAYALGAFTGKRGLALGASIGVAIVSFLVYSLAPMIDALDKVVNFVPWQWTMGGDPLNNGANATHLGLLLGTTVALFATAVICFRRRDIAN
jgi:ABC-2 type transport system permease protein